MADGNEPRFSVDQMLQGLIAAGQSMVPKEVATPQLIAQSVAGTVSCGALNSALSLLDQGKTEHARDLLRKASDLIMELGKVILSDKDKAQVYELMKRGQDAAAEELGIDPPEGLDLLNDAMASYLKGEPT